MTTVGYGDVGSHNTTERYVSGLCMLLGVFAFTFATGTLTSIMQNYDYQNAQLQQSIQVLDRIYKEYQLPLELYVRIKKQIGIDNKREISLSLIHI